MMTITKVDGNGGFEGKYNSAVGEAEKEYKLVGRYDTEGRSLGWVVSYQNSYLNANSTCAWSGQIDPQHDDPFKSVIHTTWLPREQDQKKKNGIPQMLGLILSRRIRLKKLTLSVLNDVYNAATQSLHKEIA